MTLKTGVMMVKIQLCNKGKKIYFENKFKIEKLLRKYFKY